MENAKIDMCVYDIYEILANDVMFYQIPIYQHPYFWDKDNIFDLIGDLVNVFTEQPYIEHYCGFLVLVKNNDKKDRCSIIDGQQRLAFLPYCIIRDLYSKELEARVKALINESINIRETFEQ